jgi:wee1-like protein kinase
MSPPNITKYFHYPPTIFSPQNFSNLTRQNLLKEAYALAALGTHENVVRYYGSWIEDDQLYIKTEYCGGGSLSTLFENGTVFSEYQLCEALRQVSMGLAHIHARNFVHLDIKPENIYVSESEKRIYKIGDFGLLSNADTRRDIEEGDCRYLPKELLSTEEAPVLTKADIFSLGCSIYELALHKPLPKRGEEWSQVREGNFSLPPSFSKEFEDLLKLMMHPEPGMRPSAIEMLQHPLLCSQEEKFKLKQKQKVKELKHLNDELRIRFAVVENELERVRRSGEESKEGIERIKNLEILVASLIQQNVGNRPPTAN